MRIIFLMFLLSISVSAQRQDIRRAGAISITNGYPTTISGGLVRSTGTYLTNVTGTAGYFPAWGVGGTNLMSTNVIFTTGVNVGIGTNSPQFSVDVLGGLRASAWNNQTVVIESRRNGASYYSSGVQLNAPRSDTADGATVSGRGVVRLDGNSASLASTVLIGANTSGLTVVTAEASIQSYIKTVGVTASGGNAANYTEIGTIGSVPTAKFLGNGNILIGGATAAGSTMTAGLVQGAGAAPTTSPADVWQGWGADIAGAGDFGYNLKGEGANAFYRFGTNAFFGGSLTITNMLKAIPSATQVLAAGSPLVAVQRQLRVAGSGGAVTCTATPSIADGSPGDEIIIMGTDDTNTWTIQDEGTLASSNVYLGAVSRTLGSGDVLYLTWSASKAAWVQVSFNNN